MVAGEDEKHDRDDEAMVPAEPPEPGPAPIPWLAADAYVGGDPLPNNFVGPASTARRTLIGFIIVFAIASVLYRVVYATGVQQTAALYVGIPAVLAIGLTFVGTEGSALGMLLKGSMIALLLAGIVLPEGLICILFAAPLVALVAVIVGGTIDAFRRWSKNSGSESTARAAIALPLLLMSFEGLIGTPFDTNDAASAERVVAMSPDEVRAALAEPPAFDPDELPRFLKLGFNRPIGGEGEGLEPGDERVIHFTGGNHDDHPMRLFGITGERSVHHHSMQRLRITSAPAGTNRVEFAMVEDTTMTIRWAALKRAVVTWQPVDATHTRVTWRLEYERLLHPAFYFGPMERFAAGEASGYLIDSLITNHAHR